MVRSWIVGAAVLAAAAGVTSVGNGDVMISEIMYNPISPEDAWEWVEIVNTGSAAVNLESYVIDDANGSSHGAANVGAAVLEPGGVAVLYNADDVSRGDFVAAWGSIANLVPVTGWSGMSLNNGSAGDRIGLWSSYTAYDGDHESHSNAVTSIAYLNGGDWPASDGFSSIRMAGLDLDPLVGESWLLSSVGDGLSYRSLFAGGNSGGDIGSPGALTAVPGPGVMVTVVAGMSLVGAGRRRRH